MKYIFKKLAQNAVTKDPILTELTVTENGVYDKPRVEGDVVVAPGVALTLKSDIDHNAFMDYAGQGYYTVYWSNDDELTFSLRYGYSEFEFDVEYQSYTTGDIYVYHNEVSANNAGLSGAGWYDDRYRRPCDPPIIMIPDYANDDSLGFLKYEKNIANALFVAPLVPADGWSKVAVNIPNDMLDVESLPNEDIDTSKVYRVVENNITSANFYINDGVTVQTLDDKAKSVGMPTPGYYIPVDELPETSSDSPVDIPAGAVPIFISTVTGEARAFVSGNAQPLQDVVNGLFGHSYEFHGIAESIDDMTEVGYYTMFGKETIVKSYGIPDEANTKTVYEHNGTEWVECGSGGSGKEPLLAELTVTKNGVYDKPEFPSSIAPITYDGVMDMSPSIHVGKMVYVKVSDVVLSADDLIGATITYSNGDSITLTDDYGIYEIPGAVHGPDLAYFSVADENMAAEADLPFTNAKRGTYVLHNDRTGVYVTSITFKGSPADAWNKVTVNVSDAIVPSVEVLPRGNVAEGSAYMVTTALIDIYVYDSRYGLIPFTYYFNIDPEIFKVYFINSPTDMETIEVPIDNILRAYVVEDTGIAYCKNPVDGSVATLGEVVGGAPDKGRVLPTSSDYIVIDEPGIYCVYDYVGWNTQTTDVYVNSEYGWTRYWDDHYVWGLQGDLSNEQARTEFAILGISDPEYAKFIKAVSINNESEYYGYTLTHVHDIRIESLLIPEGIKRVQSYAFTDCTKLKRIKFPSTIKFIDHLAFNTNVGDTITSVPALEYLDFTAATASTLSDMDSTLFMPRLPATCKVIVSDELYDTCITNSKWANYASQIVKSSEVV
jgi:hypothetical protein